MKTKQILLLSVLMIGICSACLFAYHQWFKPRTAYVEINKIFNNFQFKKELEDKFKQTRIQREKILDSLSFSLQALSRQLSSEASNKALQARFDQERESFLRTRQQFEEDNNALSKKYDGQIFEQMTQYVIEYGKERKYDYIYGADGNGNLMFAREGENISEEVIQYINNKYKGIE